jgi:hypothetical protein
MAVYQIAQIQYPTQRLDALEGQVAMELTSVGLKTTKGVVDSL